VNVVDQLASQPAQVDVSLTEGVDIVWKDGHASHYYVRALRAACPCATCVDLHGSGKRHEPATTNSAAAPALLPIFKPTGSTLTAVKPVGRYALNFIFSDGHNTGIFTWEYLRELCPCPMCHPSRQVERPF